MTLSRILRLALAGLILVLVQACDNAEERAANHTKRGLAFVESGENEKAKLEFRNALQLNENALEPRLAFARLVLEEGHTQAALGNFLKVVELAPENLEARRAVGRILVLAQQTEEAARHVDAALALAPEDIEIRGLKALLSQQQEQYEVAAELARGVLADAPGDMIATLVLGEQAMRGGDPERALTLVDQALEEAPEAFNLHIAKLEALEAIGDQARIGDHLEVLAGLFPDNLQVARGRVQWFINQERFDEAVAAQRVVMAAFPDDPQPGLDLINLIGAYQGEDAARAELGSLAAGPAHQVAYGRALADFELATGNVAAAVAHLETMIAGDAPEEDRHDLRGQLGGILYDTDDKAGARAQADAILSENAEHVEGLKLRAALAIDEDRADDAIADLRTALNVSAQNPSVLVLLARAHERNGSTGLAQERLALAVQASGDGIVETLGYVEFLMRQDKADIARAVLENTLSRRGDVPVLLSALARVHLQQSDWSSMEDVAGRLEALGDLGNARGMAQEIRVAALNGQRKFDQTIGVLQQIWAASGDRTSAMESLISSYVQAGQIEEAEKFLDNILADERNNMRANLLRGAVHAYKGESEAAEARYRQVIADHPEEAKGYSALASLLRTLDRGDEASEVIRTGIASAQNTENLVFTQAVERELDGDFEGAIALYEQLYAADTVSDVLANNLASLLSEHRDDSASLERAFTIAKRLRNSNVPAFQDTYGWILYKRGEYEGALKPLTAAADGLPGNMIVHFHLGMTLSKLGLKDKALASLQKSLELGTGSGLPQVAQAREEIKALQGE